MELADKSGTRGREFDSALGNENRKTFALVRDRHPGRGVLVRAKIKLEPLDPGNSKGTEVADKWLFLVQVKEGWRVAWFAD